MKTTYYISILLLLLLGFTSCGKNKTTTVSGRLMQSCDTPAANREGSIITSDGLLTGAGEILFFKSDENGYFEATYNGRKSITSFRVSVQGSGDVLRVTHLEGEKKDLGDVYIFPPNTSFYLSIEVEKEYSNLDTLFYPSYNPSTNNTWIKVPGPFYNGIIDTVHSSFNSSAMPITFNSSITPKSRVRYYINEYVTGAEKETTFPTPHCQEEYQMVTLVID